MHVHSLLQTHKDISGIFQVKNKERLTFSGEFQEKHLPLNYQALKVKATFTQQLEVSSFNIHVDYPMTWLGLIPEMH